MIMKTINSIFILTAILLGTIPLQYSIAQQQDPVLRFERCQECSNTLGNNHNTSMTIPQGGFNYNAPQDMESRNVASDFGRRGAPVSRWHMGVDINSQDETEGGNADAGDHILPIETGTVTAIKNLGATDGLKFIVIEGNHIFGYGHLFFDTNNANFPTGGQKCGDMILKKMDAPNNQRYAIIYNPVGGIPTAYSIVVGTVTHPDVNGGLPLTTTNQVTDLNIPIASMGNSGGNFGIHLHLYSFTINDPGMNDVFLNATYSANNHVRTAKDPLQIIEHDEPNYTVTINTDDLTYVETTIDSNGMTKEEYSSISVGCKMEGESSGTTYDGAVMNIDDVELFIKQKDESDDTYTYIRGVWLDSKISHGAVLAIGNEEATDRYPSPGFPSHNGHVNQTGDFPFRGVDIAHPNDTYGQGDRDLTGINPSAYSGNPRDDFYFSDIKLRIHKDDNYIDTQIDYALVNQDARYPDDVYHLRAKATTVRGIEHYSDEVTPPLTPPEPVEIKIDNFRPYIKYLKIEELVGNSPILLYEADWISNGDFLCYGTQDPPPGNIKAMTDATSDIVVILETSEAMTDVSLRVEDTGNGQGFYNTNTTNNNKDPLPMTLLNSATNYDKWQIIIPYEEFPEFAEGFQTLHITGHDRATTLNNLLGFSDNGGNNCLDASQLPHRTGSSTWSIPFANTDQIHIFEIGDCNYNDGEGNEKSNSSTDCLADFEINITTPSFTGCGTIPYIPIADGGFMVAAGTDLIATADGGAQDVYQWDFDGTLLSGTNPGQSIVLEWNNEGTHVLELVKDCEDIGECSTRRVPITVAPQNCEIEGSIIASFQNPSICDYINSENCTQLANGAIFIAPNYYRSSGCYKAKILKTGELDGSIYNPPLIIEDDYGLVGAECLSEGLYAVEVIDQISDCSKIEVVALRNQDLQFGFSISPEYISACGGNDVLGSVSVYITNPLGCMNDDVTVPNGTNLIQGTHDIDIHVSGNPYTTTSVYIPKETAEDGELDVSFTVQAAVNGCNGSITLNVTGGSGTYKYLWSNGGTTANISGLCIGTYNVDITDDITDCETSAIIHVSGKVGIPVNPDVITHIGISPNPFNNLVDFGITLSEIAPNDNSPIPVTISIYDANGSHIATNFQGNLAPNSTHSITIDMSSYTSGTYIFTAQTYNQGESVMGIKN